MATERKKFVMNKKKAGKGQKPVEPQTAEEYLEAGVELEEAGEKWRAGDAAKSLRFFTKAIEKYQDGLGVFPRSLDLAYNKGRLQYDVAQQPRLYNQLRQPVIELLKVATESHIQALRIDAENTDVLFNLAQLQSSLAEAVLDSQDDPRRAHQEASRLIHESLEYFESCLRIQEGQYVQENSKQPSESHQEGQASESDTSMETMGEEVWASVVEPVTVNTLQETCLAQLEGLKTLCSIQSKEHIEELALIEQIYRDKLSVKINLYSQNPENRKDAVLAKAAFLCVYAGARYRLLYSTISKFDVEFQSAILDAESLPRDSDDASILLMIADAHAEFNTSFEDRLQQNKEIQTGKVDMGEANPILWKHLTYALELYASAIKVPKVPNLARIYIKLGDCELLRIRLGEEPFMYDVAEKGQSTLIHNASVYYGAAKKALLRDPALAGTQEESDELDLKNALVSYWQGFNYAEFAHFLRTSKMGALPKLEEMKDQGLLSETSWDGIQDAFAEV